MRTVYTPNRLSNLIAHPFQPTFLLAFWLKSTQQPGCSAPALELCIAWYDSSELFRAASKSRPAYPSHYQPIHIASSIDKTNWSDIRPLLESIRVCGVSQEGYMYTVLMNSRKLILLDQRDDCDFQNHSGREWILLRVPLILPNSIVTRSLSLEPKWFGPLSWDKTLCAEQSPVLMSLSCRKDLVSVYAHYTNTELIRYEMNLQQCATFTSCAVSMRTRITIREVLGLSCEDNPLWMQCCTREQSDDLVLCHRFSDQLTLTVSILRFPIGKTMGLNVPAYPLYMFPISTGSIASSLKVSGLPDVTGEHVLFWGSDSQKLHLYHLSHTPLAVLLDTLTSTTTAELEYPGRSSMAQIVVQLLEAAGETHRDERHIRCYPGSPRSLIACLPVTRFCRPIQFTLPDQLEHL
ncbi:unnamed protein product, partial [Echinostoma caproni]|uniref:DPPIV_N domain-containing protein n=1 Tax=Echinostoma caproni TaxID=27848 RepID=A0A183AJW5_9TREM